MTWSLQDLVFLRGAGVIIDADDFVEVFQRENMNRNFSACECGAKTREQHKLECRFASILAEPDWYRRITEKNYPNG